MRRALLFLALLPAFASAQSGPTPSGPALQILSSSRTITVSGRVQSVAGWTASDSRLASNPNLTDWSTFESAGVSEKIGNGAGTVDFESRYGRSLIAFAAHTDANASRADLSTEAGGSANVVQETLFRVDRVSVWALRSTLSAVYGQNAGAGATVELYDGDQLLYGALSDADETFTIKLRPFARYRLRITTGSSAFLARDLTEETFAAGMGDGRVTLSPAASSPKVAP